MMKKIQNFQKHQKRFIGLSAFLFLTIGILHTARIFLGWGVTIGAFTLTPKIDVLATFIALSMAVMGTYYYLAKD